MGKGKEKVDTSKWNAWEWNEETQTEYRSRQDVTGNWEYEHRQQGNPRTTGPNPVALYPRVLGDQVENNDNYDDNDGPNYDTSQNQAPSSMGFTGASLGTHGSNLNGQLERYVRENYSENYDGGRYQQNQRAQLPGGFQSQTSIVPSRNISGVSGAPLLSSSAPDSYLGNVPRSVSSGGWSPTGYPRTVPPTTRTNSQPNVEVDGIERQLERMSIGQGRGSAPQMKRSSSKASSSLPSRKNASHKFAESSSRNRPEKIDFSSMKAHPVKDFKVGRIVKTIWTEPRSNNVTTDDGGLTNVLEKAAIDPGNISYTSVRRFAIIRIFRRHCICLPIATYGYQGTTKKGLSAYDHALIYTNEKKNPGPPKLLDEEPQLLKNAIRVEPHTPRDKLDRTIHKDSDKYFKRYYNEHHSTLDVRDKNPDIPEEDEDAGEYVDGDAGDYVEDAGEVGDYEEGYDPYDSQQ